MNAEELTNRLIEKGVIEKYQFRECAALIQGGIDEVGEEAMTERVLWQTRKIYSPKKYIARMLEILKSESKAREEEKPQPIETRSELEIEEADYKLLKDDPINRRFAVPNDPRFNGHPSIFDAEPYRSMPPETQALYRENTFLSVMNEAREKGISMHELCRRKKLFYGMLIG